MVKRICLFGGRQRRRDERDDSEVWYHRNLPAVSVVSVISVVSALTLIAKFTFQFSRYNPRSST